MTLEEVSKMTVEERLELLQVIRESFEPRISEDERNRKLAVHLESRRQAVLDGRQVPIPWDDVKNSILTFGK